MSSVISDIQADTLPRQRGASANIPAISLIERLQGISAVYQNEGTLEELLLELDELLVESGAASSRLVLMKKKQSFRDRIFGNI